MRVPTTLPCRSIQSKSAALSTLNCLPVAGSTASLKPSVALENFRALSSLTACAYSKDYFEILEISCMVRATIWLVRWVRPSCMAAHCGLTRNVSKTCCRTC